MQNTNADEYIGLDRRHLETCETGSDARELCWLETQTRQSRIRIALAARIHVHAQQRLAAARVEHDAQRVGLWFEWDPRTGSELRIEKLIALYSSRDHAWLDPRACAARAL